MLNEFINGIPKAELHVHIEGTFEPELIFKIAKRNNIELKYKDIEELRRAYSFKNLQEFLNIYYEGARVLQTKEDFFDLTYNYLQKAHLQNVIHTEIFFDPQTHTERGIPFSVVIEGIHEAVEQGKRQLNISAKLIMCFLRHLSETSAFETLRQALPHKDKIAAVGLDSSEVGNAPSKFQRVFDKAREEGFLTVAHAGEEGPSDYIWQAINLLNVNRIDHGNRCLDDKKLVQYLVEKKVPLTVCPLSNLRLQVIKDMQQHPLKEMLDQGLMVTINSDDPAYFGGYINENLIAVAEALSLDRKDIIQLIVNSFMSSFLSTKEKIEMITRIRESKE